MGVEMLARLVETFCAVDDFCKAFLPQWEAYLIRNGTTSRGPEPGLSVSEIITILLMLHGSRFKYLKRFYNGVTGEVELTRFRRRCWGKIGRGDPPGRA